MHKSANESYDSRDYFNCPIGIIAMINRTMNHGYDSRDAFNSSIGIITMINMIPEMLLIVLLES